MFLVVVSGKFGRISVSTSKKRERLEEGRLLGHWLYGPWQALAFQALPTGPLQGLDMVFANVSGDIYRAGVYAFFVSPQPRLLRGGRMAYPIEWLVSRSDPEIVAERANHL